jgi:dethiobiotin synthetase
VVEQHYFVSGIGTDVGKTVVSAILCQWLKSHYWKPVQSGDLHRTDSMKVKDLVTFPEFQTLKERYVFSHPLSPHVAAKLDGVSMQLSDFILPDSAHSTIIEGAGGLMVPLNTNGDLYIDLLKSLEIPVFLISRHYLGSINHTLLSVEALKNRQIPIAGLIFNGDELPETESIILQQTGLKKLFTVPHFENLSSTAISAFVKTLPPPDSIL